MNNVLQGESSEDPVIIWGVQAYNREDAPTTGKTSLLKGREVLWADLKRIASGPITTLGVIIGSYTLRARIQKNTKDGLQHYNRGEGVEE